MTKHPVFRALNRPMTILGVERKLFFAIALLSFSLFHLFEALVPALVLLVCSLGVARAITQADPAALRIVMNSNRFAARYDPAKRRGEGRSK